MQQAETLVTVPVVREPRGQVVRRRTISIGVLTFVSLLVILLFPLLLGVAFLLDLGRLFRRGARWVSLRLLAYLVIFLMLELGGVLALGTSWLLCQVSGGEARLRAQAYAIQRLWTGANFEALRALFQLGLVVEGGEVLKPTPYLLFIRHTSIIDTLLPAALLANPQKVRLRYALKDELLADPCLDIAGNRMPNAFLKRGGDNSSAEIARLKRLCEGLKSGDAVLIYPEGTRFTPARQKAALKRIEQVDPQRLPQAQALQFTLPPRIGGPLALLDSGLDVVVCAHTGLDGFARVADIWRGAMVGKMLRVRVWRIPARSIPVEREARIDWLYATWADVDAWVARNQS